MSRIKAQTKIKIKSFAWYVLGGLFFLLVIRFAVEVLLQVIL
jgi:hypothetical protein